MMIKKIVSYIFILFSFIFPLYANAGVVLNGTRLIFKGDRKDATIELKNPDQNSYLIQSWVSLNDTKSDNFIVTPPLFRMDSNTSNVLRVILTKPNLPQDKESLFWLNVKAIPSSNPDARDSLLIAINNKIKLIYRPASLQNKDEQTAYRELKFEIDSKNKKLIATNPTAYYINLSDINFNGHKIPAPGFVAPFSNAQWSVDLNDSDVNTVTWNSINDFGGITKTESVKINLTTK